MGEIATIDRRTLAVRAALGAIAGALAFLAADHLGVVTALGIERLLDLDEGWLFWIVSIGSGAAATTRRGAVVVALGAGAITSLHAMVAFTPLAVPLVRRWTLHEEPRTADAIVVLSSDVTSDGHLSSNGVTRLLRGLELARAGYASLLVRTRLPPPHPDDTADARVIAAGAEVEIATVGPVWSTRDEAVRTAELAEARGLHRVIVVTQPMHERRAAAAFRAVGLEVIACPSPERGYSIASLDASRDRVRGFHDWITERSAWTLYSLRGWARERSR